MGKLIADRKRETADGVDNNRTGIIGFSYGAMLGFNVAYAHSNIQAIVDIYGYMEMRSENNLSNDEFIPQLPPTCLIHGDEDKIVTIISAKLSPFRPRMGLQVTVDVLQYQ